MSRLSKKSKMRLCDNSPLASQGGKGVNAGHWQHGAPAVC